MSGYGDGCSSDCVQTMGILPAVPVIASAASGVVTSVGGALSQIASGVKSLFGKHSQDYYDRIAAYGPSGAAAGVLSPGGDPAKVRAYELAKAARDGGQYAIDIYKKYGVTPGSITVPGFSVPLPAANTSALVIGAAVLGGILLLSRRRKS
jgi:LPXTG-motif cell wall-anchored protein